MIVYRQQLFHTKAKTGPQEKNNKTCEPAE
jgi:hypothetical protein